MLHDIVHTIVSDSCYTVNIHHPSLCGESKRINSVDVNTIILYVLLQRNLGTMTA